MNFLAAGATGAAGEDAWGLVRALEQIDSEKVRELLRRWAGREAALGDPVVRADDGLRLSRLCYQELMNRGDEFAISHYLNNKTNQGDEISVVFAVKDLSHFPSGVVAREIRKQLADAHDDPKIERLIALLGKFGDESDEAIISRFIDHPDEAIANIATESLLRLTDPLLVPEKWRVY